MVMESLEQSVAAAVAGDPAALEAVLRAVKDDVYGLALRMLLHPADAEDATQEVLLRIVTRLSTFEGRSSFRTWAYRIAVRTVLNFRRGRTEPLELDFESFGADLLDGLGDEPPAALTAPERSRLRAEVKIACTQAMLMCLDRDQRMAYLLGVILELDHREASECLGITPAAYRKRLSRARAEVESFTREHCGMVASTAACRCGGRVARALSAGRIDPARLLFTTHPVRDVAPADAEALARALGAMCESDALMRSNPAYLAPERLLTRVRAAAAPTSGTE